MTILGGEGKMQTKNNYERKNKDKIYAPRVRPVWNPEECLREINNNAIIGVENRNPRTFLLFIVW